MSASYRQLGTGHGTRRLGSYALGAAAKDRAYLGARSANRVARIARNFIKFLPLTQIASCWFHNVLAMLPRYAMQRRHLRCDLRVIVRRWAGIVESSNLRTPVTLLQVSHLLE